MKAILLSFSLSIFLGMPRADAAVWQTEHQWSESWEKSYQEWTKQKATQTELFISTESPYFGLTADCADALYAMRAIFSFEHKLPFAVIDHQSTKDEKGRPILDRSEYSVIDQSSSDFDHLPEGGARLVGLLNHLFLNLGTHSLKYYDTYPIALSSIRPGDLFHYQFRKNGAMIRHAMGIQEVNPNGTFNVIYSTQATKRNNQQFFQGKIQQKSAKGMKLKKQKEILVLPSKLSKGFVRFIWPRFLTLPQKMWPSSWPYTHEQYELANSLGAVQFRKHLKDLLKTQDESPSEHLKRMLGQVCRQVKDRVQVVNEAIEFQKGRQQSCMSFQEYDTYSTPMRDADITSAFEELFRVKEMHQGVLRSKNMELARSVEAIRTARLPAQQASVSELCEISIQGKNEVQTITLRDFYLKLASGKVSTDPHQGLLARWGLAPEKAHDCTLPY